MKILESQNSVLTNPEVYQFLVTRNAELRADKSGRRPGPKSAAGVITREVMKDLICRPSPVTEHQILPDPTAIPRLVERLQDYDLAKGEVIMMVNLRPASAAALNVCIEEMEERFDNERQQAILDIVACEVGTFSVRGATLPTRDDAKPVPSIEGASS